MAAMYVARSRAANQTVILIAPPGRGRCGSRPFLQRSCHHGERRETAMSLPRPPGKKGTFLRSHALRARVGSRPAVPTSSVRRGGNARFVPGWRSESAGTHVSPLVHPLNGPGPARRDRIGGRDAREPVHGGSICGPDGLRGPAAAPGDGAGGRGTSSHRGGRPSAPGGRRRSRGGRSSASTRSCSRYEGWVGGGGGPCGESPAASCSVAGWQAAS